MNIAGLATCSACSSSLHCSSDGHEFADICCGSYGNRYGEQMKQNNAAMEAMEAMENMASLIRKVANHSNTMFAST